MSTKVLVADDILAMRQLLRVVLQGAGYNVVEASDGRGVLQVVESDPHLSLVLLDVSLPDANGFNLIKRIHGLRPGLKVCFVSGKRQKEDVLRGIQSGATDYLLKPIEPAMLLRKVEAILHGRLGSEHESGNARLAVDFPIEALNMPFDLAIQAREISESGLIAASAMTLKVGSTMEFAFAELARLFNAPSVVISCRITGCKKTGDEYQVHCDFVGLQESVAAKIRSLAIRQAPKH